MVLCVFAPWLWNQESWAEQYGVLRGRAQRRLLTAFCATSCIRVFWQLCHSGTVSGGFLQAALLRGLSSTLQVLASGLRLSNPAGSRAGEMNSDMREWTAPHGQACPVALPVTQGTG